MFILFMLSWYFCGTVSLNLLLKFCSSTANLSPQPFARTEFDTPELNAGLLPYIILVWEVYSNE